MNRLVIAISLSCVLGTRPAAAASPAPTELDFQATISPGEVTPTPEMWFYEQYRLEYLDPKLAVRKKAEFRAAQRRNRLAALKWFGFSNLRPQASSDPFHGDWSPSWQSNNVFYPFRWNAIDRPWIYLSSSDSGTRPY